jgi:hypothetical protein
MADKPRDNRPAMEHGEVKVIKNAAGSGGEEPGVDPGKTPGSAEEGTEEGEPTQDFAGKTPGSAEAGND